MERHFPPASTSSRLVAESGVAMVEMALVLPLLLVLLMGMLDFGRAINYWNDVNHIAGEGARFAAVNNNPGIDDPTPEPDFRKWLIKQAETGELVNGSESVVKQLEVCVSYPNGAPKVGDPVKVTAKAEFGLLPIVDEDDGPTVVSINGSATMRLEVVPPDPADGIPAGCETASS